MKRLVSLLLLSTVLLSSLVFCAAPAYADDVVSAGIYGTGMENWDGSPNKGEYPAVTQILFCPLYNGKWSTEFFYPGLTVTVSMRSSTKTQVFEAKIATVHDGGSWGICRIEPCLLEGANLFIPEKNVYYEASFSLSVRGMEYTFSVPQKYYLDGIDPIVPGSPIAIHPEPCYDEIENYKDKTCFIVTAPGADFISKLKSGDLDLKVVIRDESSGAIYTIGRYAFDTPSIELYSAGSHFLRLAVCEYGIVPEYGHAYTVTLTLTSARTGAVIYEGSSQTGAYDSYNAAFIASGAIVPEVIAHYYEESALNRSFCFYDVNGSGAVDIQDVASLLDCLSGTGSLARGQTGDLDLSGSLGVRDVTMMLALLEQSFLFSRNQADSGWILRGTTLISGDVAVPDSYQGEPVTQISPDVFSMCRTLNSLSIPASVTWIPEHSFDCCDQLKSIRYGGKPSAFYAGGARIPQGCRLTCSVEDDMIDAAHYENAVEISDLSGYNGILRVKTTGELLFSPALSELRSLISGGESYDDFTSYLRFSDDSFTYPTVTVDPKKSKGLWVDYFLMGDGIDCGFCPTAGTAYEVELAVVRRSDPYNVLFYGTYSATASEDFAQSPYYDPTPADADAPPRTYLLRYTAGKGGTISGVCEQYLTANEPGTPVVAVPDEGYEFSVWSDGVKTAERQADAVKRNTTLTAYFVKLRQINLASMYIYTETGRPILKKEYQNATIVIKGADDDAYNVTLATEIKGRGNSSWNASAPQDEYDSKNSYSIKLEEKTKLLGVGEGKSKKWVLNSNKFDASGLRNYLVWELADLMGTIGYVPGCTWVQLYINDQYRGMYMLTEKIDTGKHRVNVNDNPTGDPDKGYLIELDFRGQNEDDPWFDVKGYGPDPKVQRRDAVEFVIKSDVEGQQDVDFIRDYVQRCHDAIMSGKREEIEALVDLPSLIDMYILEELSKDCDAGRASFYICKDRGGKLFFTAPWDFDFGFGTYGPAISTSGLVSKNNDCCTWFASLITRSWFRTAVLTRMNELDAALTEALSRMETTGAYLKDDADLNAEFWDLYGRSYHSYVSSQVSRRLYSYDEHIDFIVNWTLERWDELKTIIRSY